MKKILQKIVFSIVVVIATAASVYAQVPQGFNFQAVARGASGDILAEQDLGVQVSIIKGSETGNPVYTETHSVTTNPLGLIQLVIGEGTPAEGETFAGIDFGNDNYFVKLAIDVSGGTDYEDLGTTRLLSVPYALVAQKSIEGGGSGGALTEYNLNTSEGDTSFMVKATGTKSITGALQVRSETDGQNRGVDSRIVSSSGNVDGQLSLYGRASGEGSGEHFGVYGLSLASGGGTNYGTYGYALGTGKYNYGSFGYAGGEGNGDEGEGYGEGSINFGSYGYASGNNWNNSGLEAHAGGENGKVNYGVSGLSQAGTGDLAKNHGVAGRAFGPGINYGVYGWAGDGVENYAGFFDGTVQINGDLNVTGTVNGASGGASTEYNLDANSQDSALVINLTGDKNARPFQVLSKSSADNRAIYGEAFSDVSNTGNQRGVVGISNGLGTGQQIGVFGSAVNFEGTGALRQGVYSQAASKAKLNFGVRTLAQGEGSGEIVAVGNEVNGNVGSVNIGGGFYPSQNLNANVGVDVGVGGTAGERVNLGAEFRVSTTATGLNSGVQTIVNGSSTLNRGFWGLVNGDNNNVGMDLSVNGGTSNIGLIVNAETAAELNGNVSIDGNLTVTGTVTETSDRNLKENIKPLQNGLETIMKLNPSSYNFRGDGEYKGLTLSKGLHYGLIAQEVEEILPSLVQNNKHTYLAPVEGAGPNNPDEKTEVKNMEYKTMNYTELIPVLIKAVQEQQKEIEELKAKIKDLQK